MIRMNRNHKLEEGFTRVHIFAYLDYKNGYFERVTPER